MGFTDEERWLEAERRIAPQPSPERRRASRRAWFLLICVALAYGVLVGLVQAFIPHGRQAPSGDDSALPTTLGLGLGLGIAGAGVVIVLVGLIVGLLTKRLRPTWERVDGALTWRQNRSVRRQIRRREPATEQRQAVIRAVAEQDIRSAIGLLPCYFGTALMAAGLIIALDLPEITAVLVGMLVLLAGTAAWQYGSAVRAARRYLALD